MSKLLFGDCLELLPVIPDNRFDLICADMPYGTTRCKWDSVIDLEKLWPMIKRVLKPNGVIILFAQTPFDKVLGCSNLPMLRYEWIWEKTNATGFLNAGKMPLKAHENILVFYNKLPTFNPQKSKGHKKKRQPGRALIVIFTEMVLLPLMIAQRGIQEMLLCSSRISRYQAFNVHRSQLRYLSTF